MLWHRGWHITPAGVYACSIGPPMLWHRGWHITPAGVYESSIGPPMLWHRGWHITPAGVYEGSIGYRYYNCLYHSGGRLCLLYRIYFTVAAYITLVGIYDCSIGSCLLQLLISQPLYLLYKIPFSVVTSQRAFMPVL